MTETVDTSTTRLTSLPDRSWALPLSGVVVTALSLVASPPAAPSSTTAAAVRSWAEQHQDVLRLHGALMALTAVALLLLVSHLRALMRARDAHGPMPDLAFGSGLLCAGWLLLASAAGSVLAYDLSALGDELLTSYYAFIGLGDMLGSSALVFKATLLLSVSWAAIRTALLPRWLAWTGLVLGVLTLGGLLGAVSDSALAGGLFYAGLFAFALWPLPVGISLALRALRVRRG